MQIIPVLSLSENNNRSETLELLSDQALSLCFLIETKISSQNLKSKALKGFQRLAFPKVTEEGYLVFQQISNLLPKLLEWELVKHFLSKLNLNVTSSFVVYQSLPKILGTQVL